MYLTFLTFFLLAASPAMADFEPISGDRVDHTSRWSASGGATSFEFIHNLLNDLEISLEGPARPDDSELPGDLQFKIGDSDNMDFWAPWAAWDGFTAGGLSHSERLSITWPGGRLDTNGFSIRPASADTLELVDDNGNALFWFNHIHTMLYPNEQRMTMENMDMRLTPWLANQMGYSDLGDFVIGVAFMHTDLDIPLGGQTEGACTTPNWHDGDKFLTDVELSTLGSIQQVARQAGVRVAIAPSATLRNVGTAEVPWYEKFDTGVGGTYPPPYDRDQHPFLVWSMYMIEDDIPQQIGLSAVKHAFFTVNSSCSCSGGHILWTAASSPNGQACTDTYSVGNNNSETHLGLREEVPASTGAWEQCGSMFAPGASAPGPCNQTVSGSTGDDFERRLVVDEPKLSTSGATFYFEGWYVIRDDINIFNTMAHKSVTPTLGSTWAFPAGSHTLGPAIDEWVPPNTRGANQVHVREDTGNGHYSIAVKVTPLTGGQYRYVYALMNYDYDRRFRSFSMPIPAGVNVSNIQFLDGDSDNSNDWSSSTAGDVLSYTAPKGEAPLWGSMVTFVFEADREPAEGSVEIEADDRPETFTPTVLSLSSDPGLDFEEGFEDL